MAFNVEFVTGDNEKTLRSIVTAIHSLYPNDRTKNIVLGGIRASFSHEDSVLKLIVKDRWIAVIQKHQAIVTGNHDFFNEDIAAIKQKLIRK